MSDIRPISDHSATTFPPGRDSLTDRTGPVDNVATIHVIDDDALLGATLTAGLESAGYNATYSTSAAAGWTSAHADPPDLILCDIHMPEKNGHRFLKDVRADPT
ncbi:MAG: response regulator, partial [Streptosporangiaceae bacterium]